MGVYAHIRVIRQLLSVNLDHNYSMGTKTIETIEEDEEEELDDVRYRFFITCAQCFL